MRLRYSVAVPKIAAWVYYVFVTALGAAAVGLLTDWFRRLPSWAWILIHRNDPAKQRLRDEKRQRLRPLFEKALEASEKMRDATKSAASGDTEASTEQMQAADEIFPIVRMQLLIEREGAEVVELYDQLCNSVFKYRDMLQKQKLMGRSDPNSVTGVREQRDFAIGLADQVRKAIHRTLKSLEP